MDIKSNVHGKHIVKLSYFKDLSSEWFTRYIKCSRYNLAIILFILFATVLRFNYGKNIPYSGDELGVGLLQSVGKASDYFEIVPFNKIIPISNLKVYVEYDTNYELSKVFESLREQGMHPPFYYLLLHYVIRYFGNNSILLRSLSLVFSLLALLYIYKIGKELFDNNTGILSALLLTLSPYCLKYSVLVRPYPLAMFIGLCSTYLLIKIVKSNSFRIYNIRDCIYVMLCITGLYTIYHYIFIIAAHAIFVFLSLGKNTKNITNLIAAYLVIIISFLPWVNSLMYQLKIITAENFYFNGNNNLLLLILEFLKVNFLQFREIFQISLKNPLIISLAFMIGSVFCLGVIKFLDSILSKHFIISVMGYFTIYFLGDLIMKQNTLSIDKFQFFLVPVAFLIIASGLSNIKWNSFLRYFITGTTFCLLSISLVIEFKNNSNYDGPKYLTSLTQKINETIGQDRNLKTLIITNTKQQRYILPFAYYLDKAADMILLQKSFSEDELLRDMKSIRYNNVIFLNLYNIDDRKKGFSLKEEEPLIQYLVGNGYVHLNQILYGNISPDRDPQFSDQEHATLDIYSKE